MVEAINFKASKLLCMILAIIVLLPSFSIGAHAASAKMSYAGYQGAIYQADVTIPKVNKLRKLLEKEVITVKNEGDIKVDVYIGGILRGTLKSGKSLSIHYRKAIYGGKTIRIKIQPQNTKFGKQNVLIQTSSGKIKVIGR